MSSDISQRDDGTLPASSPGIDFTLALSRMIESLKEDPSQLRNAIYELARVKLQRAAWQRDPPVNILEMRRLMLALETAIERVETVSARQDELRALESLGRLLESPTPGPQHPAADPRDPVLVIDETSLLMSEANRLPAFLVPTNGAPPRLAPTWNRSGAAPLLRGGAVAIVVLALYVLLDRHYALFGPTRPPPAQPIAPPTIQTTVAPESKPVARAQVPAGQPQSPALPLPNVYGVYAVSDGQLNELEALVGRVPDQKVFMSTPVKAPSRTTLPDGRVVFIIFRRDIAATATDRVAVRVIAKVTRAMTFDPRGKANTAPLEDQWTIRSTSHEFRVAPLSENPEMLLIRPESSDFVFPAGRYGLVLKGQAYDFTVAGRITDAVQCLERIEAANGAFYSECRNP
jgi:hypothetical protein